VVYFLFLFLNFIVEPTYENVKCKIPFYFNGTDQWFCVFLPGVIPDYFCHVDGTLKKCRTGNKNVPMTLFLIYF
jgi:hypothetical protein